ncbi:MAG TPA: hypothetical protein PLO50_02685 [Nitrospira sp.]|nr:hypothetical protein [Nitrospira sp.]
MSIGLDEQSVRSQQLMEESPASDASVSNSSVSSGQNLTVRHFRQIVLWSLQLMPNQQDFPVQIHCDHIQTQDLNHLWREV